MARHSRQARMNRQKKSSVVPAVTATAVLFAAVVGFLFYASGGAPKSDEPAGASGQRPEPQASAEPAPARRSQQAKLTEPRRQTEGAQAVAAPRPAVVDASDESPRTRIDAQLAAGEFGPALQTADSVENARERAQLFQIIAEAQMKAGELDAALSVMRRMRRTALPRRASQGESEKAGAAALAGGGTGADFQPLIDLIMQETEGPWFELDGAGGTVSEFETGVRVDPNGLLHRITRRELTGRLKELGIRARTADLNEDMAKASPLRLVSLTRLEREIARRYSNGQPVVATMKNLAGLSAVRYVFVYPEQNEIVIGGPAEGWRYDDRGLAIGAESGRPTLQLDDLVTVLRTFQPGGEEFFNCLIVPRQENMQALKAYVAKSNARGALPAGGAVRAWVNRLEQLLGEQDVVVGGVPLDSRVARVIVEADYRMKLIGIDKLQAAGIPSYFDLLPLTGETADSTATIGLRWWMTMKYDAVLHSPQRDVFEIRGSSVLCLSEDEKITADGRRVHTGDSSPTNRLFAQKFTEHFEQLAQEDTIFADLQNVFDLALVAALIRNEGLDEQAAWDLGVFARDGRYQTARYEPPRTAQSAANHRVYNGKDVVVQVAGGVRGDLMSVVKDGGVVRKAPRLKNVADRGRAPQLPAGRWWWDAAR